MAHSAQAAARARTEPGQTAFTRFFWRVTACHVVTYMIAGLLAYSLFDYKGLFDTGPLAVFMRPIDSKWVAVGPGLQIIRGLIFAIVLYPFRRVFLEEDRGWLKLWGLFLGLAILAPEGPSPGSVEGLIYTKVPLLDHLRGLPEVVLQTLGLSLLLTGWYRRPHRAWNIGMATGVALVELMSVAGVLVQRPETFK